MLTTVCFNSIFDVIHILSYRPISKSESQCRAGQCMAAVQPALEWSVKPLSSRLTTLGAIAVLMAVVQAAVVEEVVLRVRSGGRLRTGLVAATA